MSPPFKYASIIVTECIKIHNIKFTGIDRNFPGSRENKSRPEIKKVPGYQHIVDPVKFSADAVPEAALPVAVGIDNRRNAVLFRNLRKGRSLFQYIRRRIVEKHDEFPVSCIRRLAERLPKPGHFSFNKLLCLFLLLLIPSGNISPPVQIERTLKGKSLRSHQRIILVYREIILQEEQPVFIFLIQPLRLLRVPEHVVVSPEQDLTTRQPLDKGEILPALGQLPSPGVIAGEHQSVIRFHDPVYILFNFSLMALPHAPENVQGLVGLEAQVEIAQCVKGKSAELLPFKETVK